MDFTYSEEHSKGYMLCMSERKGTDTCHSSYSEAIEQFKETIR
jgi:hypothetical protein